MSGPWEKFKKSEPSAEGPWTKFKPTAQPKDDTGGGAGDFVNSMALGSSIGEQMPGGKTIADLGTKIGSGIVAATTTMPGEGYLDRLGGNYDQSMAASKSAEDERAAYDAKSPMAQGVKEIMGELPLMAAKTEGAPVSTQGPMQSPAAQPGKFAYPPDTAKEKLMEYFSKKNMGTAGNAVKGIIKEGAEEMLPYPARVALRMKRKFGGSP